MENQVDSTSNRARQQQRTFEGLAGQALKLAAAYGVFTVASRAARFIFETNKEFEQLQARLESITGSTQAARSAFDLITSFAVETPFAVQELTRAFTTLQAVGIQPTTEMLRDLGNFASAMGGNIEDFVAAITKAAQGETTQLRERFLVPVRTEGDKLIVTFRGVEHQMQRSFGGVIDGFREISRQNFAGAMEKQMNTIAGSISNLKDAAALAAKEVGEQGLNRAINDFATDITEAITGSDNFARSLGSTLAAGVRLANAAFRESRELLQFLNAFATGRDLPGQTSLGGAMDRAGGFAFGGMGTGLLQLRLQERAKSTLGLDNERDLQRADQNLARWEDLARRSKDAATAAPPPPPKADTKAFDDLIQQLTAQRKELEGGARAAFEYELQLMKLTRAQRDEALVLFDSIETLKKREKTQK